MINRIYLKAISLINEGVGRVFYFMESKGFLKPIDYSIYKELPDDKKVELPYPVNYSPEDKSLFSHFTNYSTNHFVIYSLQNINISRSGIVFKKMNNCWLSFPHTGFRTQYGWLYILKQYWFRKKETGKEDMVYVLLFDFWSYINYYHWLVDSLPRLLMVQKELKENNYSILLPDSCSKFILDTLRFFKINEITFIKKGTYFQSKNILLPYYTAGSGRIHPEYANLVRNFFLGKINTTVQKDRVYVSRNKQKARRIHNEKEVIDVLMPLGFEIIYFEDLSFIQQVGLVKGAKVMVSSHGANMTNSMFMPDNSKVFELLRNDTPNFCYWALASVTNKRYYYQLCEIAGNDHLLVDIEKFRHNIRLLLNE